MATHDTDDEPPADTDFGPSHNEITSELLTLTWQFFTQASPAVHAELRDFLTGHGYHPDTGPAAFLDSLQFSAMASSTD